MVNWRDHDEDEEDVRVVRDRGTLPERMVGWLLTYPVRFLLIMLVVVIVLTLFCGL